MKYSYISLAVGFVCAIFGVFLAFAVPAGVRLQVAGNGSVVGFANYANGMTVAFIAFGLGMAIILITAVVLLHQLWASLAASEAATKAAQAAAAKDVSDLRDEILKTMHTDMAPANHRHPHDSGFDEQQLARIRQEAVSAMRAQTVQE